MSPPWPPGLRPCGAAEATRVTLHCEASALPTDAARRRAPGLNPPSLPGPARFSLHTPYAAQALTHQEAKMLKHVISITLALIPLIAVFGMLSVSA